MLLFEEQGIHDIYLKYGLSNGSNSIEAVGILFEAVGILFKTSSYCSDLADIKCFKNLNKNNLLTFSSKQSIGTTLGLPQ
jgi:hypothetical protein